MTAGQIKAPTCIPLRQGPGTKQHIDDDTPIELSCETANTAIFYSINGEKPLPFDAKSKHTYLYQGPFLLRAGKHIIKSVAAYPDGRQSNIVSKVYRVTSTLPVEDLETLSLRSELTAVGPDPAIKQFEDEYKRRVLGESIENNIYRPCSPITPSLYTAQRARSATPTSGNRQSTTPIMKRRSVKIASECMKQVRHSPSPKKEDIEKMVQRTTAVLTDANTTFTKESDKCPQCFTDRPPNPLSKHCHHCGHYLSSQNEDGTVKCLHCHSVVPGTLKDCLICNAPVTSPKINLQNQNQVVCGSCNFVNPGGSTSCLVCESRLKATVRPVTPSTTPDQRTCRTCSRCVSDSARYCDWCGSSLVDVKDNMSCAGCNFQNPRLALYCGNCGNSLLPKKSKVCWADQLTSTATKSPSKAEVRRSVEKPVIQLVTAATQTEGIFYKSAKRLQTEEDVTTDKIRSVYSSRGSVLTPYSPGKGNWRMNIEHLCNHIKVYTQLNTEYQPIIGAQQLGKVTMATVFRELDEVNLSFVFSLKRSESNGLKKSGIMSPSPTRQSLRVTQTQKNAALRKLNSSIEMTPSAAEMKPREEPRRASVEQYMRDEAVVCKETAVLVENGTIDEVVQCEVNGVKEEEDVIKAEKLADEEDKLLVEEGSVKEGSIKEDPMITKQETVIIEPSKSILDVEVPVKDVDVSSNVSSSKSEEFVRATPARRSVKKRVPKDMHELRVGKLNTQLLQEVAGEGDETRVRRVLGQGAKASITNSSGTSALCLAVKNKHLGAVKALVEGGADLSYQVGHSGDTALHVAVQAGAHSSIKYLTEAGAKFNLPNNHKKTALDLARERHNQRAVQLFTESLGAGLLATLTKH